MAFAMPRRSFASVQHIASGRSHNSIQGVYVRILAAPSDADHIIGSAIDSGRSPPPYINCGPIHRAFRPEDLR